MSTLEKSKLYQKFLKEEINGCPNLKSLFPFLKSPDKTQEKELNGVSQLFVPGQDHVKPFGTTSRKQGSKINLMDFASNMNNDTDFFMSPIKSLEGDRMIDLNKRLNEELIKNTSLESRLKDLDFQNSSLLSQLDSLRQHLQDQSSNFMENRNQFEDNHAKLMAKLFETENLLETTGKMNECLKVEVEGVRRELDEAVRGREASEKEREELGRRGEVITMTLSEKDRQLQSKHEETHNLQKKIDFLLSDLQMQKSIQEKTNEKIKHLEEEKEEIRKRWEERVKCLNGDLERSRGEGRVHQMDNDKMRMEISSLNGQLQEKLLSSENIKSDFYSIKQQLMEKNQKEMNLVLALEKANLEINNLRTMVSKTELNCEELKNYNKTLIQKLSEFASNISNSSQSTQNLLNNLYEIHLDKNLKDNLFLMNKQEYPKIQSNPINMFQMENNNNNFMKNERFEIPVKMSNNNINNNSNNNNEKIGSNSFHGNRMNNTANNIFGSTNNNNNYTGNAEGGRGGAEKEISDLIEKKKNMETELRKIEDSKFKTGANIRRKHELEAEIDNLEKTIPQLRLRMRNA